MEFLLTDFAVEANDAQGVGGAAQGVAEEGAGAGHVVAAGAVLELGGRGHGGGGEEGGDGEELHLDGGVGRDVLLFGEELVWKCVLELSMRMVFLPLRWEAKGVIYT